MTTPVSVMADGYQSALRVRKATFIDQLNHDILVQKAVLEPRETDADKTVAYVLQPCAISVVDDESVITYPDGVSVYANAITSEQFGQLPIEIAEAWLTAVFTENPRWQPGYVVPEQEKKV